MKKLLLIAALFAAPAFSQELPHPRDMDLPESDYTRPDPVDYQLVLENGLIAYVAAADQVPLVTMSAFIRAGKVSDDQQGSAEALLDALQNPGLTDKDRADFKTDLKRMTAQLTVEMHDEWTEITLNVPVEDLDDALSMFAGLLRDPAISAANIERAAGSAAPAASDLGGESGPALYAGSLDAAVEHFYEIIYNDHPYGAQPTTKDFADLNTADVASFHAGYFAPGNMTLAVAGDIDVDEINKRLVDLFAGWNAGAFPKPKRQSSPAAAKTTLHHFPADKLQAWLVFGHDLPQVPLEDQAPLEVMNYILAGGHLWTRMTIETRYKYGYTNDASGFLEEKWFGPGGYNFRSYSRPEVIGNIYENMMDEVIRIRSEEVTDEELFVAKGALAEGKFQVAYLDGYAATRSFALERLRYGNHDRSASYVERIRSVTEDDVQDAARKYLRPDEMQVILIGGEAIPL